MILKNLHKLQIQTLFYNEKSEWTQIFLIRPDFFIAPNIYAGLYTTTHNSYQIWVPSRVIPLTVPSS